MMENKDKHSELMGKLGKQASEAGEKLKIAVIGAGASALELHRALMSAHGIPCVYTIKEDEQLNNKGLSGFLSKVKEFSKEIDFAKEDNRAPENQTYKPKYKYHR